MGLGTLRNKNDWPEEVKWMKTVTEMKIFGFTVCATYRDTVKKTWDRVVRGCEQILFSWVDDARLKVFLTFFTLSILRIFLAKYGISDFLYHLTFNCF